MIFHLLLIHADDLKNAVKDPNKMLSTLGWPIPIMECTNTDRCYCNRVTEQELISDIQEIKIKMLQTKSYLAVTKLISNTSGKITYKWITENERLYTNKISAFRVQIILRLYIKVSQR